MSCEICDKCGQEYYTIDQNEAMTAFKEEVQAIAKKYRKRPTPRPEDEWLAYWFKVKLGHYSVAYDHGRYQLTKLPTNGWNVTVISGAEDKKEVLDYLVARLEEEERYN